METLASKDYLIILIHVSVDPGLNQSLFMRLHEIHVDI
jgi:hypothetical protein